MLQNLNPYLKKALSAVLFAVLGALLIAVQKELVPLAPAFVQPMLIAALAGIAHYLDAWGHTERAALAAAKGAESKRAPFVPPLPLLLLLTLVLACGLPGCSLFGPGGSVWPKVESCAPSAASLVMQVENVLLAGGDYESALLQLAEKQGKDVIVCAVEAAMAELGSKIGASPERMGAKARAKAFLVKTGNTQ